MVISSSHFTLAYADEHNSLLSSVKITVVSRVQITNHSCIFCRFVWLQFTFIKKQSLPWLVTVLECPLYTIQEVSYSKMNLLFLSYIIVYS